MKRFYLLLIGTLAAACATYAQQLTGRVMDTQNQPIEFANVALYTLPDSSLVTGTITDARGAFTLEGGTAKRAFLKISFVGYETQTIEARPGVTVTLNPESTQLGEVTVKAAGYPTEERRARGLGARLRAESGGYGKRRAAPVALTNGG